MRQVKLLTGIAGRGYSYPSGSVVDLPDPVAERYVQSRQAVYVDSVKPAGSPPAKRSQKATSRKAKNSNKR